MMESADGHIGRILRERREELGYSIEEAEQATRIRKTYLQSLENNRFSELPGQTYVTGFIRVYAHYLGLESDPILALLNDLPSTEIKPEETTSPLRPAAALRPLPSRGGNWRKFVLAVLLVLILGCLLYFAPAIFSNHEQIDDETTRVTESAGNRFAPKTPQAELEKLPAEPTASQTDPVDRPEPGQTDDAAAARESASPHAAAKQRVTDNRALPAIPDTGASLRMLALADSSLIIKVDARKPEEYKLYDGLDLTWKVEQRVNVEFAASDVARFWLNGQELDIAGDRFFELTPAAE